MVKRNLCVLTFIILCCACNNKTKSVLYSTELSLFNNTGRTLVVYKENECIGSVNNLEKIDIFKKENQPSYIDSDNLVWENGAFVENVYVYDHDSSKLLMEWCYCNRKQTGRQLYRYSDCEREVFHEDMNEHIHIRYYYTFCCGVKDLVYLGE